MTRNGKKIKTKSPGPLGVLAVNGLQGHSQSKRNPRTSAFSTIGDAMGEGQTELSRPRITSKVILQL